MSGITVTGTFLVIISILIAAKIISATISKKNSIYTREVALNSKSAHLAALSTRLDERAKDLDKLQYKLKDEEFRLTAINSFNEAEKEKIANEKEALSKERFAIDKIIQEKTVAFPWLTVAFGDMHKMLYDKWADYLRHKRNPSLKAAAHIINSKRELRELTENLKTIQYKLVYYETLFPWLTDYLDSDIDDSVVSIGNALVDQHEDVNDIDDDSAWLNKLEYTTLSEVERSQMALDRYVRSRKSNWHLGRDYEQCIGYHLEVNGYEVEYCGMEMKLEDMGRDLIARKGEEVKIIQCKYWAQHKTIHEKHLFQLFGSVVLYRIMNEKLLNISGVFVTSTRLSERAKVVADSLGIVVQEAHPLTGYPRIKCNYNTSTGRKIFHLPFDQQYDRTKVNQHSGECYAYTVQEAVNKGYRRAKRHYYTG